MVCVFLGVVVHRVDCRCVEVCREVGWGGCDLVGGCTSSGVCACLLVDLRHVCWMLPWGWMYVAWGGCLLAGVSTSRGGDANLGVDLGLAGWRAA